MNLELRKFDISSIGPDKVCVFIGKRETGKSPSDSTSGEAGTSCRRL